MARTRLFLLLAAVVGTLGACTSSPSYRPHGEGAGISLEPGYHFETLAEKQLGSSRGTSLLLGSIPLSEASFDEAARNVIENAGHDPDDPDITVHNVSLGSSWMSFFFVDFETLSMRADVVRAVVDPKSPE